MRTNDIKKVLRILNPLSCTEMRARFDALLREELRGEEEEWVREHLLVCDECLDAFTNRVGEKVDAGEIPLREWPSDLPLPPMELYTSSTSSHTTVPGVLGIMWEEVRQAIAQEKEWAKEKLEEARRWIAETIRFLQQMEPALTVFDFGMSRTSAALPTTGAKKDKDRDVRWAAARALREIQDPRAVPALLEALKDKDEDVRRAAARALGEIKDPRAVPALLEALKDEEVESSTEQSRVPFEVREGPVFTKDGRFLLILETTDPQWEGKRVICTVALVEGRKVGFEGIVQPAGSGQRWQVAVTADGLPQSEEDTPVPLDLLRFYLV